MILPGVFMILGFAGGWFQAGFDVAIKASGRSRAAGPAHPGPMVGKTATTLREQKRLNRIDNSAG